MIEFKKFKAFNESKLIDFAKDKTKVDEFISEFAQAMGSACDVWMDEDNQKKLAKMVASGKYKFKCDCYDTEHVDKNAAHRRVPSPCVLL